MKMKATRDNNSNFFARVYAVVKRIPAGCVMTYGGVAAACGAPRAARTVGWALHGNPDNSTIPCHRVVFADGRLTDGFAFGGREVQKALLVREGVRFVGGKVDMEKCLYRMLNANS
jgi:methylated-DNA-protein-cysteine methyltransferase-like protein